MLGRSTIRAIVRSVAPVGIGASNWLAAERTAVESAGIGVVRAFAGAGGESVNCGTGAKVCAAKLEDEYAAWRDAWELLWPAAAASSADSEPPSVETGKLAEELAVLALAFEPAVRTSGPWFAGVVAAGKFGFSNNARSGASRSELAGDIGTLPLTVGESATSFAPAVIDLAGGSSFALNCAASGCRLKEASANCDAGAENPNCSNVASIAMALETPGTAAALAGTVTELVAVMATGLLSDFSDFSDLITDFEFTFKEFGFVPEFTPSSGSVQAMGLESELVANSISRFGSNFTANSAPGLEPEFCVVVSAATPSLGD